jgi:serine/threonine-protein kinase
MVAHDGTVKVLDFGIARRLDGTTLTQVASVVGTAAYMAPERALGQPGDARSDIYSLGCLLYAMLTGRPPFAGEISAAVLHQQINAEPAPPSELQAGIPAALDALVLEMLAKDPEARPQPAAEVRDRVLALSGVPPLLAAAGITAATAPSDPPTGLMQTLRMARIPRTAPTRLLVAWGRRRRVIAAVLSDYRWRAAAMGLATALVALLAVALLAGGGSHPARVSHRARPRAVTHATSTPKPTPKPPKPAAGPAPAGGPPGHGGEPPGKAKKRGDGGD